MEIFGTVTHVVETVTPIRAVAIHPLPVLVKCTAVIVILDIRATYPSGATGVMVTEP